MTPGFRVFANFIRRKVQATIHPITRRMPTAPSSFLKAGTIALAITLLSGFVFYRHTSSGAGPVRGAALVTDSPETDAAGKQIRVDSFYIDPALPSTKSSMIVPPDHPAFQQPQIRIDSPSPATALPSSKSAIVFPPEDERRQMMYSSKSGTVFEPHAAGALVNDSALKDAKADTLK